MDSLKVNDPFTHRCAVPSGKADLRAGLFSCASRDLLLGAADVAAEKPVVSNRGRFLPSVRSSFRAKTFIMRESDTGETESSDRGERTAPHRDLPPLPLPLSPADRRPSSAGMRTRWRPAQAWEERLPILLPLSAVMSDCSVCSDVGHLVFPGRPATAVPSKVFSAAVAGKDSQTWALHSLHIACRMDKSPGISSAELILGL